MYTEGIEVIDVKDNVKSQEQQQPPEKKRKFLSNTDRWQYKKTVRKINKKTGGKSDSKSLIVSNEIYKEMREIIRSRMRMVQARSDYSLKKGTMTDEGFMFIDERLDQSISAMSDDTKNDKGGENKSQQEEGMKAGLEQSNKTYMERREAIKKKLTKLSSLVEKHYKDHKTNTVEKMANWGAAGDLQYVLERLDEIIRFLDR